MKNKVKIRKAGLGFIINDSILRIDWDNADEVLDTNILVGLIKASHSKLSLMYLYAVYKRYSPDVFMAKFVRGLIEAYILCIDEKQLKVPYDKMYIKAICLGDSMCMRVANILSKERVTMTQHLTFVNVTDLRRLGISKNMWCRFLDKMKDYMSLDVYKSLQMD